MIAERDLILRAGAGGPDQLLDRGNSAHQAAIRTEPLTIHLFNRVGSRRRGEPNDPAEVMEDEAPQGGLALVGADDPTQAEDRDDGT